MDAYLPYLEPLGKKKQQLLDRIRKWSAINSGSGNIVGVTRMAEELLVATQELGMEAQLVQLTPTEKINSTGQLVSSPVGPAVHASINKQASTRIFLGAHLDTVFPEESSFQETQYLSDNILQGPGVADIKGGIAILLAALETVLSSPYGEKLGFEILFNPDEEIGSMSSRPLLEEIAGRCDYGLIFEPPFPDGTFVSSRRGSANFTLVSEGRSAHVGRAYSEGASAIRALAEAAIAAEKLNSDDVIVNIGTFNGGTASNVVPSQAIATANIRTQDPGQMKQALQQLEEITRKCAQPNTSITLHGALTRPPKPFDPATQKLFEQVKKCASSLKIPCKWKETGGVCDGNIVAAMGLPTIDTLGVVGGGLHTHDEYIEIDSLVPRTKLAALLMMSLAEA